MVTVELIVMFCSLFFLASLYMYVEGKERKEMVEEILVFFFILLFLYLILYGQVSDFL